MNRHAVVFTLDMMNKLPCFFVCLFFCFFFLWKCQKYTAERSVILFSDENILIHIFSSLRQRSLGHIFTENLIMESFLMW